MSDSVQNQEMTVLSFSLEKFEYKYEIFQPDGKQVFHLLVIQAIKSHLIVFVLVIRFSICQITD
jgi:hypothetical protein